jgi:hypothetical protein
MGATSPMRLTNVLYDRRPLAAHRSTGARLSRGRARPTIAPTCLHSSWPRPGERRVPSSSTTRRATAREPRGAESLERDQLTERLPERRPPAIVREQLGAPSMAIRNGVRAEFAASSSSARRRPVDQEVAPSPASAHVMDRRPPQALRTALRVADRPEDDRRAHVAVPLWNRRRRMARRCRGLRGGCRCGAAMRP